MKRTVFSILFSLFLTTIFSQTNPISLVKDKQGVVLTVHGKPFMINGMNWDYFPIGTNYTYSLWEQPDTLIKAALDTEMSLLQEMGVNAIRQYTGVPPKWISYIYEQYGIYTMLNHSFGRYGLSIEGEWIAATDYSNPATQKILLEEITELAATYKNTVGLLLYLLGNENNYGLFWAGAETEDFPDDDDTKAIIGEKRGRPMYRLMNKAANMIKAIDTAHPVAICNGDVLFIDIVAEECKDIDIYGTNTYRGASFGDIFQVVQEQLNKPILFTEFGADAFHAIKDMEDQQSQADYLLENWKEIYQNAAGLGKSNNSIGGFTFQFSDGWWKYGQTKNLDIHDNNASWANGGYDRDYEEGKNNMNEEWFGICAKGTTQQNGTYPLYPRAAYYVLKEVHQLSPYAPETDIESIANYFSKISVQKALSKAESGKK